MPKYKKRPVIIDAIQYDGTEGSIIEILQLKESESSTKAIQVEAGFLLIPTLEGLMRADRNDWIIKGISGELYPCKPDIFEKTYERVVE